MEIKLTELFEVQRSLDAEIERKHPSVDGEDRLAKRILALQVELGECANEWRGFKFWSNRQQPNTTEHKFERTVNKDGTLEPLRNPLLEEYVDCLHFILSIGNHLPLTNEQDFNKHALCGPSLECQFLKVFKEISELYTLTSYYTERALSAYEYLFMQFVNLGIMLGFTWQQIETAYMSKNKVNWDRQENGY